MRCPVIYLGLLSEFIVCNGWTSYEEYFILPENSVYCRDYPSFRRFSLSRQMSFSTGIYNDTWNHLLYVCKVRVYPNGRLLHYSYPQGHTSYWFHRLRVDIRFNSCQDVLTIGFIPEETTQQFLKPEELRLTCQETFPKIIDSKHRIISLVWHTETGSTDVITSVLDVQMSAYMRFEGNFGISDKIQRCETGSGFWCGNDTAVCIYGQMRCDQADGCFDGGSDEVGCPPPRNYTSPPLTKKTWGTWTTYLPWTAICLIPLALIFVLGLICTPRKSLDDLEDEEVSQLKANSPLSRTPSSATASACDSPRSTHSAIVLSHCIAHESIHRASSNPDSLALIQNVVVNEPSRYTCHRQPSTFTETDPLGISNGQFIPQSSKQPGSQTVDCCSRAVRFQLPQCGVVDSLSTTVHHTGGIRDELATSLNGPQAERLYGTENKLFAIPAHFEMAAMRVCDNAIHQQQETKTTKGSTECAPVEFYSSKKLKPRLEVLPSDPTKLTNYRGDETQDSNSSSTESHLEDVTPFRKPDHPAKLLPNGQPNGEIFTATRPANQNALTSAKSLDPHGEPAFSKTASITHPLESRSSSRGRSSEYLLL